jgi:hypothetical protein
VGFVHNQVIDTELLESEVVVGLAALQFMQALFQPVLGLAKLLDRWRIFVAGLRDDEGSQS